MGRYLLHSLQIDMGDRCWTGMDRIMAGGIGRQMDDRCLRKMGLRGGGCHEAKPALLSCHVFLLHDLSIQFSGKFQCAVPLSIFFPLNWLVSFSTSCLKSRW